MEYSEIPGLTAGASRVALGTWAMGGRRSIASCGRP